VIGQGVVDVGTSPRSPLTVTALLLLLLPPPPPRVEVCHRYEVGEQITAKVRRRRSANDELCTALHPRSKHPVLIEWQTSTFVFSKVKDQ
jgi:hypothetical protein